MGRRGYPPEFRRRALDLLVAGRRPTDLVRDLGISSQTIYNWRRQGPILRIRGPNVTMRPILPIRERDHRCRKSGGHARLGRHTRTEAVATTTVAGR
jgi:hypothetical protein